MLRSEVGKYPALLICEFINHQVDISKEMFGAIARFDHQTNALTRLNLPSNC
ncbi:MAG: hypothetical protein O4861_11335 [Trichodesmium sp. St16_bin4-tuft]|uniref:hypothetical protein n=1 Tax=Trichodesmium erythraeum TaxID=1206 RepID=UPI00003C9B20|nr:hypothetical protein [Trichodesmium erythraeum GBRTRLIN201]MCH2049092.1 hypothetical protein [Trichodesmium sp. ALOHA_ZT_67]MDE5094055.1 hypothetical protein [Trichodesmium sp. St11_bin5]MDE5098891.1 hypothetical protein [Trichodesmium sp. St16_bin4-tuft]MDT9338552.1 hypothetical protein [Trichodesmium erythraeum 21-75]